MCFAGAAKNKKKKPLKIKVGKTTGSRVVFDEEGQALQPLAQLALPASTECAHPDMLNNTLNTVHTSLASLPACMSPLLSLACIEEHMWLSILSAEALGFTCSDARAVTYVAAAQCISDALFTQMFSLCSFVLPSS